MSPSSCSICRFWHSSIGKKLIVALTGLFLVIFLAGHLAGNLLIFQSSSDFNEYAEMLHTALHGWGVWGFRIAMLVALALHIMATVQLTAANRAARATRYQKEATMVASKSSRMMIWSGLTVLVFFVFHILHYTVRVTPELKELAEFGQNWAMAIKGFQNPLVSIFYIIAMALLCSHLSHGVASIFQTLGLRTRKTSGLINMLAKAYSLTIFIGFISIPISVCFFGYGKKELQETEDRIEQAKANGLDTIDSPSSQH